MANNWISINNLMGISSRDVKQHMIKNEKWWKINQEWEKSTGKLWNWTDKHGPLTTMFGFPRGQRLWRPETSETPIPSPKEGGKPRRMINVLIWLVVWTPLKNMKVSWDDYSQYMEKKCSKPPISTGAKRREWMGCWGLLGWWNY